MKIIKNTVDWIHADYKSHKFRFIIEHLAWAMSIGAAILFAATVPNVPFVPYLLTTVTSCAMFAWSAWSRRSFGMLSNYLLITSIDLTGLLRVLFQ